jgi:hypothetical protein
VRKSTDLWIKDEVRARLFRGTLSRRAPPAAGAVGGDQLLRISSPYDPRFQQKMRDAWDWLAERAGFELTGDLVADQ